MTYMREETYKFYMDKEADAYSDFKSELKASGIPFHDLGGVRVSTIIIRVHGEFDKEPKS